MQIKKKIKIFLKIQIQCSIVNFDGTKLVSAPYFLGVVFSVTNNGQTQKINVINSIFIFKIV